MLKTFTGIALFALVGLGLCGFAASKAHAYYCYTTCNTIGGFTNCYQNCF